MNGTPSLPMSSSNSTRGQIKPPPSKLDAERDVDPPPHLHQRKKKTLRTFIQKVAAFGSARRRWGHSPAVIHNSNSNTQPQTFADMSMTELMNGDDSNCRIRWTKRLIRCSVFLDVISWLVFLILFSSTVPDSIANPHNEFHLSSQIRTMTIDEEGEGFANVRDIDDMFTWIEDVALNKLLPTTSTSAMRSTYLHKKNKHNNQGVNTINGILNIVGDRIAVRQIRVAEPWHSCSYGNCDGRSASDMAVTSDKTWLYDIVQSAEGDRKKAAKSAKSSTANKTASDRRLRPGGRRLAKAKVKVKADGTSTSTSSSTDSTESTSSTDTLNPSFCAGPSSDHVHFYSEELTGNTKSKISSSLEFAGSGYVQHIDVSLYSHINGSQLLNPSAGDSFELGERVDEYNSALKQTHDCAVNQLRNLAGSGWFDELTRAVFVEYCVAPYYSILDYVDNVDMQATGRFNAQTSEEKNNVENNNAKESVGACQRIVFEINRHGYVHTKQSIQTGPATHAPLVLQHKVNITFWIVLVALLTLAFVEAVELVMGCSSKERREHFFNASNLFWNSVDWANIVFMIAVLAELPSVAPFSPESLNTDWSTVNGASGFDEEILTIYQQFHLLAKLDSARRWFGWLILLWWFRGVGYMEIFPPIQLPIIALIESMSVIIIFLIFFAFILIGVSMTMRLWWGSVAMNFHTMGDSLISVMMAVIGDFRTEELKKDFRFPSSEVVLLLWSLMMGFIVLTMFVAIVDEGFQNAKEQLNPKPATTDTCCVVFREKGQTLKSVLKQFRTQQDNALTGDSDSDNDTIPLHLRSGEILKANVDGTLDIVWDEESRNTDYLNAKWFAAIVLPSPKAENYQSNKKRGVSGDFIVYLGGDEDDAADSILKSFLRKFFKSLFDKSAQFAGAAKTGMNKTKHMAAGLQKIVPGSLKNSARVGAGMARKLSNTVASGAKGMGTRMIGHGTPNKPGGKTTLER